MTLKVGWASASPKAKTGYGQQTLEICSRLAISERVEIYCIGGLSGTGEILWGGIDSIPLPDGKELKILPAWGDPYGKQVTPVYIDKYGLNVVVVFWDPFTWSEELGRLSRPTVLYAPIDGPLTHRVTAWMREAFKVVTFSKFGYRQLQATLPPSKIDYIPHGCDTSVWKAADEEARIEVRERIGVPEDAFLMLHVGANVGERKLQPLLMWAFRKFLEKHPDSYLYFFTNPNPPFPKGYALPAYAKEFGIEKRFRYPRYDPIIEPWSTEELAALYSAADVYVSLSIGEGFGLPLLESQACGTPVIAPINSSHTELVEGHGWLVENVPEEEYLDFPVWIPNLRWYRVPRMTSFLERLEEAHQDEGLRERYGREARRFAQSYDWDLVMPLWYRFFDELEEELALFNAIKQAL